MVSKFIYYLNNYNYKPTYFLSYIQNSHQNSLYLNLRTIHST